MIITVKTELKDGLYIVYNGRDVDEQKYKALLVIAGDDIFISDYQPCPPYWELKKVELKKDEDLLQQIGAIECLPY